MKNFRKFAMTAARAVAAAGLLVALAAIMAGPAGAQVTSAPIVVQQKPVKNVWLKASVIHADGNTIIVQDQKNSLAVYTFSFTPALRDRMQRILDAGGYQYGDKVYILYEPGQTVAKDVRGKPSRAL